MVKDTTLESKLRNLYALQQIDSSLDELDGMKGDLPAETEAFEALVNDVRGQLAELERTMKESFAARDKADEQIITLKEKLERYKTQQFQVRTNKEYDALTREMDSAEVAITKLEKDMELLEGKATTAKADIGTTELKLEELTAQLEEKRRALAEISKATEDEELRHHHEREKLVARIKKGDLTVYERIRKAKKGKAIVPVKRGACGGCFNKVPPQKLLELRQNSRIYQCEQCGRILVSDDIVKSLLTVAQ